LPESCLLYLIQLHSWNPVYIWYNFTHENLFISDTDSQFYTSPSNLNVMGRISYFDYHHADCFLLVLLDELAEVRFFVWTHLCGRFTYWASDCMLLFYEGNAWQSMRQMFS
jgi:hypothetical protein